MGSTKNILTHHRDMDDLIGGNILSLITCGMYTNPLAIYREYLQNSADAITSSSKLNNGKVEIVTDVSKLSVTIRDNGPGLSYKQAARELIPISKSGKNPKRDRGFRGIGRLAGLAFGRSVTFLTRCNEISPVTKVIWDGDPLRNEINNKLSASEIVLKCVTIEKVDGDNFPKNFFEVQIDGISRYAAASILNRNSIHEYLGEVCPVPFHIDFPYKSNISNLFKESRPLVLDVYLDGEKTPITRRHQNGVCISGGRIDKFVELEKIKVPALGKSSYAALGWIAHTSYLGAIPKKTSVRCLRARAGNIQIGNETAFDHLFSEIRFNRWCVAEIHILDSRITPNGRRDYFEPSTHLRNLENYLGAVCRKLEQKCRIASRDRNQQRHLNFFLESLEATYDLVASGYLTTNAAQQFITGKLSEISVAREKYKDLGYVEYVKNLDKFEKKLVGFQKPRKRPAFVGISSSDVPAYRKIFKILADTSPSPREAKKTIETILKYNSS